MQEIIDFFGKELTVSIATDHGGFELKNKIADYLSAKGLKVVDCGAHTIDPEDDYPDFGNEAAKMVSFGTADIAVVICTSGVGMGIIANRYHGVRAVMGDVEKRVISSREHNASNVIIIPGNLLSFEQATALIDTWLSVPFSKAERHVRRLKNWKLQVMMISQLCVLPILKSPPASTKKQSVRMTVLNLSPAKTSPAAPSAPLRAQFLPTNMPKAIPANVTTTAASTLTKWNPSPLNA